MQRRALTISIMTWQQLGRTTYKQCLTGRPTFSLLVFIADCLWLVRYCLEVSAL